MRFNVAKISQLFLIISVVFLSMSFSYPLFATGGQFFGNAIVTGTNNTFAVANTNDLQGGHMQFTSTSTRNQIAPERRTTGMLATVVTASTTVTYRLTSNRGATGTDGVTGCTISGGTMVTDGSLDGKPYTLNVCLDLLDENWSTVIPDLSSATVNKVFTSDGNGGVVLTTATGGGTGSGTVSSITAGSGLSGGTITSTGTIALDLNSANAWTGLQSFLASSASVNNGVVSIGAGGFSGGGSNFTGTSTGTQIAVNATSTYTGNLVDFQVGGNSKFKIDASGKLILTGGITNTSGSIINNAFNVDGGVLYANASGVFAQTATGTVGQVLHSNGGGAPTWSAVSLATDISGILPTANGGTGTSTLGTAGRIAFSNGSSYAFTAVGTTGQVLSSAGTGTPTWTTLSNGTVTAVTAGSGLSGGTITSTGTISLDVSNVNSWTSMQNFVASSSSLYHGIISVGNGNFSAATGTSSFGDFAGGGNGTMIAVNATSTFIGDLLDMQTGGMSQFRVNYLGELFAGYGATFVVHSDGSFSASGGNLNVDAAGAITSAALSGAGGSCVNVDGSGKLGITSCSVPSLTIGDMVASSTANRVLFVDGSNQLANSENFVFENTTKPIFKVGDLTGTNMGTQFVLDDSHQTIGLFGVAPLFSNQALVTLGDGIFDGVSSGYFFGSASGTQFAINATSTFDGDLANFQVGGHSKFSVDSNGRINSPYFVAGDDGGGIVFAGGDISGAGNGTAFGAVDYRTSIVALTNNLIAATGTGLFFVGDGGLLGMSSGSFNGSTSGTQFAMNATSSFSGSLVDLQVGGTSKFSVDASGAITSASLAGVPGSCLNVDGSGKLGTVSCLAGSITIGSPVASSTIGQVLYVDASGNLAQSDNFAFDNSTINPVFHVGDVWGVGNSTAFAVDDSASLIEFASNDTLVKSETFRAGTHAGNTQLSYGSNKYGFGDLSGAAYGTSLTMDANHGQFDVNGNRSTTASYLGFTGTGVDDVGFSGATYVPATYTVWIDSTGVTDTFAWSDDLGDSGSGILISPSVPMLLANGIAVTFNSDTGHDLGGPLLGWSEQYTISRGRMLAANGLSSQFSIGDIDSVLNGTRINIDEVAQNAIIRTNTILATPNYGLLSIGDESFDGASGNFFTGSANGTALAINTQHNDANLADFQVKGNSMFRINAAGAITSAHLSGAAGSCLNVDGTGLIGLTTCGAPFSIGDIVPGSTADRVLFVDGANKLANSDNFLFKNDPTPTFQVGDLTGTGNGSYFNLSDGNKSASITLGSTVISDTLPPTFSGFGLNDINVPSGTFTSPTGTSTYEVTVLPGNTNDTIVQYNSLSGGSFSVGLPLYNNTTHQHLGTLRYDDGSGTLVLDTVSFSLISPADVLGDDDPVVGTGVPTITANAVLLVQQDTFNWSSTGVVVGSGSYLPMTGTSVLLGGVTVTFALPISHSGAEDWTWTYTVAPSTSGRRFSVDDVTHRFALGDIDNMINGTKVTVDDFQKAVFLGTNNIPLTSSYGFLSVGEGINAFVTGVGAFNGSGSGTGIALNALTGFGGNLMDLQVGGTSKFKVTTSGQIISPAYASSPSNGGILYAKTGGNVTITSSGSSTEFLHGGLTPGFGPLDFSAMSLAGVLSPSYGGTGTSTIGVMGQIPYSNGSSFSYTSPAPAAGVALISTGVSSGPTWFAPTAKSILFAGTGGALSSDSSYFNWDSTNHRLGLGLGASSPVSLLNVIGSNGATATSGLVSIGGAIISFDGTSPQHFQGSASGTILALNSLLGFNGSIIDAQRAGVSKFAVSGTGAITIPNYAMTGSGILYTDTNGLMGVSASGTPSKILHGGPVPYFGFLNLATEATGTLPVAAGGTGLSGVGVPGTIAYSTGSAFSFNAATTATGLVLVSGGTGAPTWYNSPAGTMYFAGDHGQMDIDPLITWDKTNHRLGVGTTGPASVLSVIGNIPSSATGTLVSLGASFGSVGAGYFSGSASGTQFAINTATGFTGNLADFQVWGSSKMTLNSSGDMVLGGKLGLGTTSPKSLLHVDGVSSGSSTGLLSVGNLFNGGGAPNFNGSSFGTIIAVNTTLPNQSLIDMQAVGVSKFKVDGFGSMTLNNGQVIYDGSSNTFLNKVVAFDVANASGTRGFFHVGTGAIDSLTLGDITGAYGGYLGIYKATGTSTWNASIKDGTGFGGAQETYFNISPSSGSYFLGDNDTFGGHTQTYFAINASSTAIDSVIGAKSIYSVANAVGFYTPAEDAYLVADSANKAYKFGDINGTLGNHNYISIDDVSSATSSINMNIANAFNVNVGTSSKFYVGSNGYAGIGTTNPGASLEVVGDILSKGTSWTAQTAPVANQWTDVAYGNGTFVAVSQIGATSSMVMTSPDGVNWTSRAVNNANSWSSVTYGNGMFVAVARNGTSTTQIMTSPTGEVWTSRSLPAGSGAGGWHDVAYGNGLFIAVSPNGSDPTKQIMTSPDGVKWKNRTAPANVAWGKITYGNGKFVGLVETATSTNQIMTSSDGITWSGVTAPITTNVWGGITYGNGKFVAISSSGGVTDQIMTSPDGVTWTSRSISPPPNIWKGITYGNGLFVAVSQNGATSTQVITSPDSVTWTYRASTSANQWQSVAYGNGTFVAVSLNGTTSTGIMTSGFNDYQTAQNNNIYQGGIVVNGNTSLLGSVIGLGDYTSLRNSAWLEVDDRSGTATSGLVTINNANLQVIGTGTTCNIGGGVGGTSCTSDARLKTNVADLKDALDNINKLHPVTYNWIDSSRSSGKHIGFIAQEMQKVYPDFVSIVDEKNGYLGIDYSNLVAPLVAAVQQMDLKLEPLTSLDPAQDGSLASLIKKYLADAMNGIEQIFANKVQTKELCLDDVCVTQVQMRQLLNQANVLPVIIGPVVVPTASSTTPATSTLEIIDQSSASSTSIIVPIDTASSTDAPAPFDTNGPVDVLPGVTPDAASTTTP